MRDLSMVDIMALLGGVAGIGVPANSRENDGDRRIRVPPRQPRSLDREH
jgi:hypothetical protein